MVSREVVENLGSFGATGAKDRYEKRVQIMRWNDSKKAVVDIRAWDNKTDRPLKGLCLTYKEAKSLSELLSKAFEAGSIDICKVVEEDEHTEEGSE